MLPGFGLGGMLISPPSSQHVFFSTFLFFAFDCDGCTKNSSSYFFEGFALLTRGGLTRSGTLAAQVSFFFLFAIAAVTHFARWEMS